jgi:hypothetical protein
VRDYYLYGIEGEVVPNDNPDLRSYVWRAEEDSVKAVWITFKKNAAGSYIYTSRSISNIPKA